MAWFGAWAKSKIGASPGAWPTGVAFDDQCLRDGLVEALLAPGEYGHMRIMEAPMVTAKRSLNESIALLIDADNAPSAKIDFIIGELAFYGGVNIRRAYGNWNGNRLQAWVALLNEYAIQPVQQFDYVKGKNATDISMVIYAMDILHSKSVSTFCLVSSDSDFTPLAQRLRQDGKRVIGFGSPNTPISFVNSCSRFLSLDENIQQEAVRKNKARNATELKSDAKLINLLRTAVKATADEAGWAVMGAVGSHISNQGPFDSRNFGFSKLSELIAKIDLFEMRQTKNGPITTYWVRDKKAARIKPAPEEIRPIISENGGR